MCLHPMLRWPPKQEETMPSNGKDGSDRHRRI